MAHALDRSGGAILDNRTLFLQHDGKMPENELNRFFATSNDLKSWAKIYRFPDGSSDIICSTSPDFGPDGWEEQKPKKKGRKTRNAGEEDEVRSMRRAKSKLRRLALSNDFRWFVTLTLNPEKVDSLDPQSVIKKLNSWASNMVQRKGLKYALVPERHKSGRIHFHGFFNDVLEVVDSGHRDKAGHVVYNLPQWSLGFTTAIELYDDYRKAVSYVCKYIGKQGEKPAGRWYYSGGTLELPQVQYADLSLAELQEQFGNRCFVVDVPGRKIGIVHDIKE